MLPPAPPYTGIVTQQRVIGLDARGTAPEQLPRQDVKGSTTIVELLRMYPDGEAARLMATLDAPVRALRRRIPRAADARREAAPP